MLVAGSTNFLADGLGSRESRTFLCALQPFGSPALRFGKLFGRHRPGNVLLAFLDSIKQWHAGILGQQIPHVGRDAILLLAVYFDDLAVVLRQAELRGNVAGFGSFVLALFSESQASSVVPISKPWGCRTSRWPSS